MLARMSEHEYAPNLDRVLTEIEAGGNYTAWIVDRARPYLRGRVLDAGAGTGTFTETVARVADEVVALEPDPRFVDVLRDRFADDPRVHVVHGETESLSAEVGEFDAIVCFNVLEHVHDDEHALRVFYDRLRVGGALLLLVPAHPSLVAPFDRAVGHVRRYSRRQLARSLDDAGFVVEALRHVNPVGALGWFVRMRLLRQREWPTTSFRVFDRLVPLLRPLDALHLPFGLSLWAVARRP
jgi:SAM-dependent methyltransferase